MPVGSDAEARGAAQAVGEQLALAYLFDQSIGRLLIQRGELTADKASMQGIKAWAAANPAKLQEALSQNPSYVFFRELPTSDGPMPFFGGFARLWQAVHFLNTVSPAFGATR